MATLEEMFAEAKAELKQKKLDSAISKFEQVIELDDRHREGHETLASLYFAKKEYEKAATHFKRVAILDPTNSDALINAGAALNKAKEFREAVKTLRQALAKNRRSPEAYYNLGIAERGMGQQAMAVSAYKEAIRINPEFVEAYSNLGSVLLEMNNLSQAILYFRKALEVQPDFEKAQRGLKKAEDATFQKKQNANPFGRLVDMDAIEKKGEEAEQEIELTTQQRYEDRDVIHKLSKESELVAIELLTQLKEELSPAVLDISRLVQEEKNSRQWAEEQTEYESAMRRFRLKLEKLLEVTDALRKHEESIQELVKP